MLASVEDPLDLGERPRIFGLGEPEEGLAADVGVAGVAEQAGEVDDAVVELGEGEDRLLTLTEEYYEDYLRDAVIDVGAELVERARKLGQRIVFISDNIDRTWQNLWGDICDQIYDWSLVNSCPLIMSFQALDETVTEDDRVDGQGFWQGVEVAFNYDEAGGGA